MFAAVIDSELAPNAVLCKRLRRFFGLMHVVSSTTRTRRSTAAERLTLRDRVHEAITLADAVFEGYPNFKESVKCHLVLHYGSVLFSAKGDSGWDLADWIEMAQKDPKLAYVHTSRHDETCLMEMAEWLSQRDFLRVYLPWLMQRSPTLHPAALSASAAVEGFVYGAVVRDADPECAPAIVAAVNVELAKASPLLSVKLDADGKTIVPVGVSTDEHATAIGTALYDVARVSPTVLVVPPPLALHAGKLREPKGNPTLADLAWAVEEAGCARLRRAFLMAWPASPTAVDESTAEAALPAVSFTPASLALCRTYPSVRLIRSGGIDVILRRGHTIEYATRVAGAVAAVESPHDPALLSCGTVQAFAVIRVDGSNAVVDAGARKDKVSSRDMSDVYALVHKFAPTLAHSDLARSVPSIDLVAPRELAAEGQVDGLFLVPFASITRRIRTFTVHNYSATPKQGTQATRSTRKHRSPIGYNPVGPYRVNIFCAN
jgi:hypothetical protein